MPDRPWRFRIVEFKGWPYVLGQCTRCGVHLLIDVERAARLPSDVPVADDGTLLGECATCQGVPN
jgi:hypothetical protein